MLSRHHHADNHVVHIRLTNGAEVNAHTAFKEIAKELLTDKRFVQCHRSFIVNMNDITVITAKDVTTKNGSRIPISRGFAPVKNDMLKWMFAAERTKSKTKV